MWSDKAPSANKDCTSACIHPVKEMTQISIMVIKCFFTRISIYDLSFNQELFERIQWSDPLQKGILSSPIHPLLISVSKRTGVNNRHKMVGSFSSLVTAVRNWLDYALPEIDRISETYPSANIQNKLNLGQYSTNSPYQFTTR